MAFDAKIYASFEIPHQKNVTKTETKYSLTCPCVVGIIKKEREFKPPYSTHGIG
jgi:hypothetical protein